MLRKITLVSTLLVLAAMVQACGADCDVATYKMAECISDQDGASVAQQEYHKVECQTGENSVYYQCWEEVDTTDCQDAQLICAQYDDNEIQSIP